MAQDLGSMQREYAQIQQQLSACQAQQIDLARREAAAAMNGNPFVGEVACTAYLPGWIGRAAQLEADIARLQRGDYTSTPCQLNGIAIGCNDDRR
jgi:hypothetical protein